MNHFRFTSSSVKHVEPNWIDCIMEFLQKISRLITFVQLFSSVLLTSFCQFSFHSDKFDIKISFAIIR